MFIIIYIIICYYYLLLNMDINYSQLANRKLGTRKIPSLNEGPEKQITTLREKLDQREHKNKRLINEGRSLEAKLKPENAEKVKKKSLEKTNARMTRTKSQ